MSRRGGSNTSIEAQLILPIAIVHGRLEISKTKIIFEGYHVSTTGQETNPSKAHTFQCLRRRVWGVRIISRIFRRRYLLKHCAMELYFVDGTSCFLNFQTNAQVNQIFRCLYEHKPPCLQDKSLLFPDEVLQQKNWTDQVSIGQSMIG